MSKQVECPRCLAQDTRVRETRYTKKMRLVKRSCLCMACGNPFMTVEIAMKRYLLLMHIEALFKKIEALVRSPKP